MIRHEKHLLPPHEHKVGVVEHVVIKRVQVESFGVLKEAEEFSPVLPIHFFVGVPLSRKKGKFPTNNLAHEACRQGTELLRQPVNLIENGRM